MKRSRVVHLAAVLIAALYLLASSPVAAQQIVPLPNEGGVYASQQDMSKTVPVTSRVDWLFCIDSISGFFIRTPSPVSQTEIFEVKQTDSNILGFSNSETGPFSPTITVVLNAGTNQSAPFYVWGKNLGTSVFSGCSINRCTINNESILVYGVESVKLEEINSPFDSNPNAGDGLRIFPDKKSGTDNTDMKNVRVTANLSIGYDFADIHIPVFFKSFDVDDPSSDDAPVDSNGPAGDDNRGTPKLGQLSATQAPADTNGVAHVDFTVTMQPGDNFKVAASCWQGYLDKVAVSGINLAEVDADGSHALPSKHVQGTDMLTVWRRLHIEVDSMGPVQGNSVEGTVTKARPSDRKGQTVLTLSALDDHLRFEPGRITIGGTASYSVVDSGSSTVTIEGVVADSDAAGKSFKLVDDDDFNGDDGKNLDGDEGEDLTEPDQSIVRDSDDPAINVFAPAYIRPTYDLSNSTPKVPFVLNYAGTGDAPQFTYPGFDNRGTSGRTDFWTSYLLGAYQAPLDQDGDGDKLTAWGYGDTEGASVFLEEGRSWEESKYASKAAFVNQAATTAHELGHWFKLLDCKKSNPDPEGGLMCWPPYRLKGSFSSKDLDLIRRRN